MYIVLATDNSADATAAVDFLTRFPFPGHCTITLLAVIDVHVFVDTDESILTPELSEILLDSGDMLREEAQRFLAVQAERIRRDGWTVSTVIRTGYAAEEIVLAAGELAADLVIVGSHGVSGLRRFLLGSVSGRVLQYAPCSVLIVKGAVPDPADWRVLLAYDDSEPSRKALSLCASLPFRERDAVHIVTVLGMVTAFRQDIRQQINPVWQQKKIAARAALDGAVAQLHGTLPNVSSRLREGSSNAHEIIESVTESGSNLVMLGWKGKTALRRFLLGSMTGYIARHAPCSVWVVRD